jgi:parvulin-like peptidyl-prolyl isomerase
MDGYNRMKDELFVTTAMLKFQLIDIEVAKLEVAEPNQSRLEQARELADELMRRLQAGEDFGELANKYSHGHRRQFGGLWKPVQPGSLAEPYDILAAEAELIEPGQLAGPTEADGHIFIMKLVEKRPEDVEPFEKVQEQVKAKIIFERRKRAVDKLTAEFVQQVVLNGKDEFIEFCTRKIYLMSNQ